MNRLKTLKLKRAGGTSVKTRADRAEALRRLVCELLKWQEEHYAQFVWDCGLEYLRHYLPGDEHSVKMLEYSRVFWAWWKNHWANRDENFILMNIHHPLDGVERMVQLYEHYNDGALLAKSIHPNSTILNETYALMMKELVAEEIERHKQVKA